VTHFDLEDATAQVKTERGAGAFPTTHWSAVLAAADPTAPAASRALEELCRVYWQPAYAFCRWRGSNPEDARDLTQAFFADLLTKGSLERADPARGRFRSYLLGSLKHFLADEHDRAQARKRGGGIEFVPVDVVKGSVRQNVMFPPDAIRSSERADY